MNAMFVSYEGPSVATKLSKAVLKPFVNSGGSYSKIEAVYAQHSTSEWLKKYELFLVFSTTFLNPAEAPNLAANSESFFFDILLISQII